MRFPSHPDQASLLWAAVENTAPTDNKNVRKSTEHTNVRRGARRTFAEGDETWTVLTVQVVKLPEADGAARPADRC